MEAQPKKRTIASMRKNVDNLTLTMQTFCLYPCVEAFKEICDCPDIARNEGNNFTTWKLSVMYKYGAKWGFSADPIDGKSLESIELAWMCQNDLLSQVIVKPSRGSALKILHMFFATGELRYIDLFYQCIGNAGLPVESRKYLADLYIAVRDLYRKDSQKYLAWDANHFTKIGMRKDIADFSYFDNIGSRAKSDKDAQTKASAERAETAAIFGQKK